MSILIIGEKPSVSRAISAVVGASSAHKGYTEGNGYIVSWCVGHLVGLKFPNDYGNGWDQKWSFSQLPMIPDKWQFQVAANPIGSVQSPEKPYEQGRYFRDHLCNGR